MPPMIADFLMLARFMFVSPQYHPCTSLVDLAAPGADHDAGPPAMERDVHLVPRADDLDLRHRPLRHLPIEAVVNVLANLLVLDQEITVVGLGSKPRALPAQRDSGSKTCR